MIPRGMVAWLLAGCGDAPAPSDHAVDGDGDGVAPGADCDDGDASVGPGAAETCNQRDDDCDGDVDEDAADAVPIFTDDDGDGFGGETPGTACAAHEGQSVAGGDCDDADPRVHPDAIEVCNEGIDDDCDGLADDADDPTGTIEYYVDDDSDGYGSGAPESHCAPAEGSVANASDCDDGNALVRPGALEICNDGVDDDCDPTTSEHGLVDVDGARFWSIQDALDAAPDGGTVALCDGVWFENLRVAKNVTIEGRGAERSVVDGSGWASVVAVDAPIDLVVRGMTLQNGAGDYVAERYGDCGGAIQAWVANSLVVESSIVADSVAEREGGGILGPEHGSATLTDVALRNNEAGLYGGGAYFWSRDGSAITIEGSTVSANTAGSDGGGLYVEGDDPDFGVDVISETVIENNLAGRSGGGMYLRGPMTLEGVTISANEALTGAGVLSQKDVLADDATEVVDNATPEGGVGGGAYLYLLGAWRYGRFAGNSAAYGAGVAIDGGTLGDVLVEDNHATVAGGGVWLMRSVVRDSEISRNTADELGGGIYATTDDLESGSFAGNCTLEENVAAVGGGAMIDGSSFESEHSDWGAGATDNSPEDVAFRVGSDDTPVVYEAFESDEDFVCDVEVATCE